LSRYFSCFVLAALIPRVRLSDEDVLWGYKGQSKVENGLRFIKDPLFFASSLFVKKTSRVEGQKISSSCPDFEGGIPGSLFLPF
ncbi:MAG: hypothetical protein KBG98_09555, partial [Desulfobacter sp.]|nr:hypothetical protein [Desulfobacter sp.]